MDPLNFSYKEFIHENPIMYKELKNLYMTSFCFNRKHTLQGARFL